MFRINYSNNLYQVPIYCLDHFQRSIFVLDIKHVITLYISRVLKTTEPRLQVITLLNNLNNLKQNLNSLASVYHQLQQGPGWLNELDYLTTHTNLSPIRRGFAPAYQKIKINAEQMLTYKIK
jgi:hypothetical protein